MDGCPPRARGTAGNPSAEQAIGWNPNDIGGGKTAGARRAENSMTGGCSGVPSADCRSNGDAPRRRPFFAACINQEQVAGRAHLIRGIDSKERSHGYIPSGHAPRRTRRRLQ